MAPNDSGMSGDSRPTDHAMTAIVVFVSLSLYNVAELGLMILSTFKRRRGLYFWSFVVATFGIAPYAIGFLLKGLQLSLPGWGYVTLIVVGWSCMVTGQSLVLYSRLHLVLRNAFRLRLVLAMIVTNAFICHIPITVMAYGANSSNPAPYVGLYSIYERVQVTLFFLQEMILSALYIYETVGMMRVRRRGASTWCLMTHLIAVNVTVVVLDVTILGLEYSGLYDVQTSYKALVYSIKLKLEFSILNRLVEVTRGRGDDFVFTDGSSSYARTGAGSGVRRESLDARAKRKNWADNTGAELGPAEARVALPVAGVSGGETSSSTAEVPERRRHRRSKGRRDKSGKENIDDKPGPGSVLECAIRGETQLVVDSSEGIVSKEIS
ncbi:uncharacterized protein C8A04DRAFT_11231 [Dichotomopilus funicola]|uniref:DUF7703 domain-containing protein n=1 Tax=Dichotomopilus funicola TaxID=1934379 RepID=A0AAN6ZMJ7_9PEZI|nr:hypothetical protein C8A04DRAFT_11231 [Dichotomopilus funicola]